MRWSMARTLEELPLYSKVLEFWGVVSAILKHSQVRRNRKLYEQIDSANDSMDSNMKEGFEQPTDAAFANFVVIAKGSVQEIVTRMRQAHRKQLISDGDLARVEELGGPLGKMMGGFIKYLHRSGFTDRGSHSVAPKPRRPRIPNL
jgi:four helix bundle protein